MNKICLKCGNDFFKKYHESKKSWLGRMYCSKSCSNSVNANPKRLIEYTLKNGAWNKGKVVERLRGGNNHNWAGGEVIKICLECKSLFKTRPYRKNIAKFCSHVCSSKNRNYGLTPKNNAIRKSAAYKAWRTLVFERDDYTCVSCNVRGFNLHADHIKPFAFYPELRLDVSNGRTLCESCHKKTETYGNRKILATTTEA